MVKRTPPQDPSEEHDDAALFREAVGPVRELPSAPLPPASPKPHPRPRMAERDEEEARAQFRRNGGSDQLESGDGLSWRRDEVPPRVLQRLRRGQYAAQDELDLHHAAATRAEAMLRDFLKDAVQAGFGCVRIVHGKGLHSETGVPVLKNLVDRLLRQRADVLAFHSAPPAQGGRGAVLVLLRQRR
ncbi:MAG: SMR domain protein [Lysobacter sp.]|nr:SMR domain protein [Lysobacter sp.]